MSHLLDTNHHLSLSYNLTAPRIYSIPLKNNLVIHILDFTHYCELSFWTIKSFPTHIFGGLTMQCIRYERTLIMCFSLFCDLSIVRDFKLLQNQRWRDINPSAIVSFKGWPHSYVHTLCLCFDELIQCRPQTK